MRATITNNLTGVAVQVTATTEHPESHYGHAVWVDKDNVAYAEVGYSGAPLYTISDIEPTGEGDDWAVIIGWRISGIRTSLGLSQSELAESVGMHQSNIARIERGRYSTSVGILGKIAEALGKRVDIVD
jgi:DNA-binding XRE family transcriptional regulator